MSAVSLLCWRRSRPSNGARSFKPISGKPETLNWEEISMRMTRRIAVASLMAVALATPAFAADKDTILASVPGLTFPFFVHMMKAFVAEGEKQGYNVLQSDGQVSSPKQTADIEAALT